MKSYLFYRSNSEDEPAVRDYMHEIKARTEEGNLELKDVNSIEGDSLAKLHDVISYPSVIVTDNDGKLVFSWMGMLPLISELTYYLHQN